MDTSTGTSTESEQPEEEFVPRDLQEDLLPIYVLTGVFGIIFIVGPLLVRKGENQGVVRCCIMLSAFCMWIFWVTVYTAQINPLIGPRIDNNSLAWMAYKWGKKAKK